MKICVVWLGAVFIILVESTLFIDNLFDPFKLNPASIFEAFQNTAVEFDLYTHGNETTPLHLTNQSVDELKLSAFDPKKLTVFVSHGWGGSRKVELNQLIKNSIFGNYDVNLFIIDWHIFATTEYFSMASKFVDPTGEVVGQFINQIQELYDLDGSSFILIGFSLGAHVVGKAGATVRNKVSRIIGLDPAQPNFIYNDPEQRLDISDAKFVQVIHTNGDLFGFWRSIGHIDYFPNAGLKQPGCTEFNVGCSHTRAYEYLAEALQRGPSVFKAYLCPNWDLYLAGQCVNNSVSYMGDITLSNGTIGNYFLKTNDMEPFGLS